jgi:hypothetical protein
MQRQQGMSYERAVYQTHRTALVVIIDIIDAVATSTLIGAKTPVA